jgi:RNA polymerase sigma factor (sigma-70 family)
VLTAAEEAEFWAFYKKTSEGLFRKAYRMCHGHHADADDAQQRTYLKALEHWPTIGGLTENQRNSWLATTLAREVLQIWRTPHRAREAGAFDDAGRPDMCQDAHGADAIFAAGVYHRVCRAIARLKGRQRDVIALHCLAGYEISEVAEMLGISSSTVRVHLSVGRRNLLKILAREEGPA